MFRRAILDADLHDAGLLSLGSSEDRPKIQSLPGAVQALRDTGKEVDDKLLPHLSSLGWEHINLTGDYIWRSRQVEQGKFRPLRMPGEY